MTDEFREQVAALKSAQKHWKVDRDFERAMGMAGPAGALGYYWLRDSVPAGWVALTWLAFAILLLLLSIRKDLKRKRA